LFDGERQPAGGERRSKRQLCRRRRLSSVVSWIRTILRFRTAILDMSRRRGGRPRLRLGHRARLLHDARLFNRAWLFDWPWNCARLFNSAELRTRLLHRTRLLDRASLRK